MGGFCRSKEARANTTGAKGRDPKMWLETGSASTGMVKGSSGGGVKNSTKTKKGLVLKEGLVLLLGTVLSQRRLSTMRGVEL